MKRHALAHQFVEAVPDRLEDGVLYVSMKYATAAHRCCCGCGSEVVTPLSPSDWRLTFDGESITLYPSIGNWSFACRSHYWIGNGKVKWDRQWSAKEIAQVRTKDRLARHRHYSEDYATDLEHPLKVTQSTREQTSLWTRVKKWVG